MTHDFCYLRINNSTQKHYNQKYHASVPDKEGKKVCAGKLRLDVVYVLPGNLCVCVLLSFVLTSVCACTPDDV